MKRQIYLLLSPIALVIAGCSPEPADRQGLQQSDQRPSLAAPKQAPKLPDFSQYQDVGAKKQAFFSYLEPLIDQENQHIQNLLEQLKKLHLLLDQQSQLHPDDQRWLDSVSRIYRVKVEHPEQQLSTLLAKLGQIPPALVKAQAANESAWGTSRFARQANNLFGQWCFTPGCGIAPLKRSADQTHEVQAFDNVAAALRSYFTNLNSHQGYISLREIRRCLKQQQLPLTGRALAAGLTHYSARGNHYVDELRTMIRYNKLENWQANWWGEQQPQHPCYSLVQVEISHPDPIIEPQPEQLPEAGQLAEQPLPEQSSLALLATPTTAEQPTDNSTEQAEPQ